jgi:hypothetical protein
VLLGNSTIWQRTTRLSDQSHIPLSLVLHLLVQWKLSVHYQLRSMIRIWSSMPPTRTLMTHVQQNRNSRYLLSTVEKMHGFFCSRPLFWKSLFGVIPPSRPHLARPMLTPLTHHRLPFRFRYIPRILHLESTICRLPKHTYHRDLRHGPNVSFYATRFWFIRVVS